MTAPTLKDFRAKIDAIDNQIIKLLSKRMEVVKEVAKFKRKNHYQFFIRFARESDMIKNLQKHCNFGLSKSAIFAIWRKIIASSNALEQELKIIIHNPHNIPDYRYLAEQYYGSFIAIDESKNAKNIISQINSNKVQIGIFAQKAHKNQSSWWIILANNKTETKIFGLIPPIKKATKNTIYNQNNLYMVANKDAEKSTADNSLLTIKTDKKITQNKILSIIKKTNLRPKILDQTQESKDQKSIWYLIELKGFYTNSCKEIIALASYFDSKTKIKIIGNYPTSES